MGARDSSAGVTSRAGDPVRRHGAGVGRAASCGLDDGGHLAEVVRSEDAGADDRQHRRVDAMIVVEAVDDSARDAQHLARTDLGLFSVERPGQHARKPVDRLLVTVMAVRDGHSGSGWDVELEDCDRTSRRLAFEQESDRQLPDPYLFASDCRHEYHSSSSPVTATEPTDFRGPAHEANALFFTNSWTRENCATKRAGAPMEPRSVPFTPARLVATSRLAPVLT